MTSWLPELADRGGPRYLAIADCLADDIRLGRLAEGERLPTHRDLADSLGLTVGTVSRAYAEAERRGLLHGEVGRGTFVGGVAGGWDLPAPRAGDPTPGRPRAEPAALRAGPRPRRRAAHAREAARPARAAQLPALRRQRPLPARRRAVDRAARARRGPRERDRHGRGAARDRDPARARCAGRATWC